MASDRLEQLTPRERECLRLVSQGRSSKEIAIELDLSPFTVDEYVKSAVGKLGASNRREAARMLAPEESGTPTPPQKLGDEPPDIAPPAAPAPEMHPVRSEDAPRWRFPLRQGRQFNDLGQFQRLTLILLGAVLIIVLFSQLANGLAVIQAVFKGR